MRDWEKFDHDEIITIWRGYLATDFRYHDDPLQLRPQHFASDTLRLTPMEITKLVEELMKRLEMKLRKNEIEAKNGQKD